MYCKGDAENGTKDIYSYRLNTLILKGTRDGSCELAAENLYANKYSSYDGLEKFRGLDTNVDISLRGDITYEMPQLIFLYSLSPHDMEYRYIPASYIYTICWLKFDKGKTQEVRKLQRTFYNWLKYCGGGIWGVIEKPIFYVSEFVHMEKRTTMDEDYKILKEILSLALKLLLLPFGFTYFLFE